MREYAGLRLAVTTLTIVPMRPGRLDRATAGRAMCWAPAVGAVLAAVAALFMLAVRIITLDNALHRLLAATVAIAFLAIATRALHWDGLADTIDGLGVADRERALAVMRASDIGAFGVLAMILAVVLQVSAIGAADIVEHGSRVLVCGVVAGRVAMLWACRHGVPAARPEGLGALVAGTVPAWIPLAWTTAVVAIGGLWAYVDDHGGPRQALVQAAAILAAITVGAVVTRALVRRLGGITGDVLGAVCEITTTVAVVAAA